MAFSSSSLTPSSYSLTNFSSSSSKPNHISNSNKILIHPFSLLHRAHPTLATSRIVCASNFQGTDSFNFNSSPSVATSADTLLDEAVGKFHLPKGDSWSVHKFGGTCVGNSDRIRNVANIIVKDDSQRKLAVVSAMSKVTDMMYDLIDKAQSRDDSYINALDAVLEKHKSTAADLLDGDGLANFLDRLYLDINNLKAMLRAIFIGMPTPRLDLAETRHLFRLCVCVCFK